MALKDLLLHLDDTAACAARIETALTLAATHGAHVAGLYVIGEPSPAAYVRGGLPEDALSSAAREARARADAALGRFRAAAEARGISFETRLERVLYTEVPDIVVTHARHGDLVILGQVNPADDAEGPRYLTGDVIVGAGRPVLVVPYDGGPFRCGAHVLVAWDASQEATRAVHDAVPILRHAAQVSVLTLARRGARSAPDEASDARLAGHLARHGAMVEVRQRDARGLGVANAILTETTEVGADLLVMGAYGHSRLREVVLGGVTRTILRESTIPVLVSH